MDYTSKGKIILSNGGLFYVKTEEKSTGGKLIPCRARGKFRHMGITPLVGDDVRITYNDRTLAASEAAEKDEDTANEVMIVEILERKNALIRPPLANLDILFVSMAAAYPSPILSTVDKLIAIAEHNGIEPVIIIGKNELDKEAADRLEAIYKTAGFEVFSLSALGGEGVDSLEHYLRVNMTGKIAAFSGASGVGKSSLMNRLFPHRHFETGALSDKIERGKNTTRQVELFEYESEGGMGYIADTPGFSLLDFVRFDFFGKEDLPLAMREFRPYIGKCRYKKCTHTKEEGCAILEAVTCGDIPPTRHESFLDMYAALRDKPERRKKS